MTARTGSVKHRIQIMHGRPPILSTNPIFCAIDRPDVAGAEQLVQALGDSVGGIKLGLEFFCANGPDGVRTISRAGRPIFLDLKLHDIPNTVAGSARAAFELEPAMLTLHACGGAAMLNAAVKAKHATGARTDLLAVTVLTSLDDHDLTELGIQAGVADHVERLARLAVDAGVDGIVCSPHELIRLRAALPADIKLVVPGIRQSGPALDDQKRIMTPKRALEAGAHVLVIGRPITGAADPAAAARSFLADGA